MAKETDKMDIKNRLSEKGQRDFVIIERANKGDQGAYAELLDLYRESIYYLVLKMVNSNEFAEDLTIEVFGKAFSNLKQYQPNYAFSTWLYRIATNNCIDFIRKQRISTTSIDSTFDDGEGEKMHIQIKEESLNPEERAMKKQKSKYLRQVVKKLKPHYSKLIELRYFKELSYEEIAAEMEMPLGTVKAQLFRAREFLAKLLSKDEGHL
jgi:RNA polymerase sigma-70 factor (ECF subfamily)